MSSSRKPSRLGELRAKLSSLRKGLTLIKGWAFLLSLREYDWSIKLEEPLGLLEFEKKEKGQAHSFVQGAMGDEESRLESGFLEIESIGCKEAVSYTHLTLPTTPYV